MTHLQAWQGARTFDDLCELTAQYVEGQLSLHPSYGAPVDAETTDLVPTLASFNRSGFMTDSSQPGVELDDSGEGQRAYVTGFALESTAKKIATLGLFTDLLVLIVPPLIEHGYQIPVTLGGFHPYTWCGLSIGDEGIEDYKRYCNVDAVSSLSEAWQVTVIDLQWGRFNYLWENVSRILTSAPDPQKPYSVTPSPDLELDTDFVC